MLWTHHNLFNNNGLFSSIKTRNVFIFKAMERVRSTLYHLLPCTIFIQFYSNIHPFSTQLILSRTEPIPADFGRKADYTVTLVLLRDCEWDGAYSKLTGNNPILYTLDWSLANRKAYIDTWPFTDAIYSYRHFELLDEAELKGEVASNVLPANEWSY